MISSTNACIEVTNSYVVSGFEVASWRAGAAVFHFSDLHCQNLVSMYQNSGGGALTSGPEQQCIPDPSGTGSYAWSSNVQDPFVFNVAPATSSTTSSTSTTSTTTTSTSKSR